MSFITVILEVLWFMLPAYGANMVPGLFKNTLKPLGKPIDRGKTWRGKRIFGDNKTYRGLIVGVFFSILLAFFQSKLYMVDFFKSISIIDYSEVNFLMLGVLLGFGALFGDMIKSFFKRRKGIKFGDKWIPFDQIDWVIGSVVFVLFIYIPDIIHLITIIVLFPILHVIINHIAFFLKLRDKKW